MENDQLPLWLSNYFISPEDGIQIEQPGFGYTFNLFSSWGKKNIVDKSSGFEEHIYHGTSSLDWLIVTHMKTAIAGHNMAIWVKHYLDQFGFPSLQMAYAFDPAPVIVTWEQGPAFPAFLEKIGCDEMLSYTGSTIAGGQNARLFLLMLRKENLAWKIFLSVNSDWGSGDNEVETLYNDHLNASQIFGSLALNYS